ncbi:hypothetical protein OG871_04085 [Kitasatospora sp. NBC_00374]|uniref:hypothetical protein n=1 Tax=Kitasatospora sp. NBC_00374 TaxID=2975964 RepID=UPI00324B8531
MPGRTLGGALVLALGMSVLVPTAIFAADTDPVAAPAVTASESGQDPAAPGTSADVPVVPDPSASADPSDPAPSPTPSPTPTPTPSPTPPPAATVITFGAAAIDPKLPGRVRLELLYTCAAPDGERSLNTSVEQPDPTDPATTAFGSTRTSPTLIVCDGTQQRQSVTVQSKTSNWLPDVDAVLVTTLSDLGAAPPAAADARKLRLKVPAATAP